MLYLSSFPLYHDLTNPLSEIGVLPSAIVESMFCGFTFVASIDAPDLFSNCILVFSFNSNLISLLNAAGSDLKY